MKITDNKFKMIPDGDTDIEKIMNVFLMAGYSRTVSKSYAESCYKHFMEYVPKKKRYKSSIDNFVIYDFTLEKDKEE